jgi:YD repeat-containing protein
MRTSIMRTILRASTSLIIAVIVMFAASPAMAERYEYDPQGRLTSVTYADGKRLTYTYDPAGNVLSTQAGDAPDRGCCRVGGSGGGLANGVLASLAIVGLLARRRPRADSPGTRTQ